MRTLKKKKFPQISITSSVCKGFRWQRAHGDTTPQQLPQASLIIIILWQEQQPVTNEQLLVPPTSLHRNPGEIGIFPSLRGLPRRDKCHPEEEGFVPNWCQHKQRFVFRSGSTVVTMSHNESFPSLKPGDGGSGNQSVPLGWLGEKSQILPGSQSWLSSGKAKMALETNSTTSLTHRTV